MHRKLYFLFILIASLSTTLGQLVDDPAPTYDAVPIQFVVSGLPDVFPINVVNDEMMTVLRRVLSRVADQIPGMRIASLERVTGNRKLGGVVAGRALAREVAFNYNVNVISEENKQWGELIIQELRDTYEEVLEDIRSYEDMRYVNGNVELNWCAMQDGDFNLCVREIGVEQSTDSGPFPELEVIPIKIDITGLPDDVQMEFLKDEVQSILQRVLLRLADIIPGLTIVRVESNKPEQTIRALAKSVTLYYNVNVLKDERKEFGPIIINELREVYDNMLGQILSLGGTRYIKKGVEMNWCISDDGYDGVFDICVKDRTAQIDAATTPATAKPVDLPVTEPSALDTGSPTRLPTGSPVATISFNRPSMNPSSSRPTVQPTSEVRPATISPSRAPSEPPSTQKPTDLVTSSPTSPPTRSPVVAVSTTPPTASPNRRYTPWPSKAPIDWVQTISDTVQSKNGACKRNANVFLLGIAAALRFIVI